MSTFNHDDLPPDRFRFLFCPDSFEYLFSQAPIPVKRVWYAIERDPRHLFDAGGNEWRQVDIRTKIDALRVFNKHFYLDRLLVDYVVRCRQHAPEYLVSIGAAIVKYAAAGFCLRLPISPLVGPIQHPGYVASVSRMLEDHQISCSDLDWLTLELRRLRRAIDDWLAIHVGYTPNGPT